MSSWRKIVFLIVIIFNVLLMVLIYRAYVLFKPCQHDLKPLGNSNKIKLDHKIFKNFLDSLKFQTISYDGQNQNLIEMKKYVEFIRTGKIIFL